MTKQTKAIKLNGFSFVTGMEEIKVSASGTKPSSDSCTQLCQKQVKITQTLGN